MRRSDVLREVPDFVVGFDECEFLHAEESRAAGMPVCDECGTPLEYYNHLDAECPRCGRLVRREPAA